MERILHQVNIALRCLDGNSGRPLATPVVTLDVTAAGRRLVRSRSGLFVLVDAPATPELAVTVEDPAGVYLPRRATLALPRDPDPTHLAAPDSLFRAADLALYPAPAAPAASGWAVVRATVVATATGAPLPGALLRLTRTSDGSLLARGVTDWRGRVAGEGLVAAPGVPAITFGAANNGDDGAVLVSRIAATLEAIFDPQHPAGAALFPDPDDLERRRVQLPHATAALEVGAGVTTTVRIAVAV